MFNHTLLKFWDCCPVFVFGIIAIAQIEAAATSVLFLKVSYLLQCGLFCLNS